LTPRRQRRTLERGATSAGPLPVTTIDHVGNAPQLFSARIRCHTVLPMFGGLADIASFCPRG